MDWAAHAGGIDAETAMRCRAAMIRDAARAQKVLRRALRLRETIYGIGSAIARTEAGPLTDLETLKRFARGVLGSADLVPAARGGYAFDFSTGPVDAALLGPVVWSALELLGRGNFERLKQCPSAGCGWLFFDSSRNNSRRWCDMATCGNRTKARRHRQRHPPA